MEDDWKYIRTKVDEIAREQVKIKVEIATLKIKASLWGFLAGAIPSLVAVIITTIVK